MFSSNQAVPLIQINKSLGRTRHCSVKHARSNSVNVIVIARIQSDIMYLLIIALTFVCVNIEAKVKGPYYRRYN